MAVPNLAHVNEDEDRDAHQWSDDEKTARHARPGAGKIPIHHYGVALRQVIQHGELRDRKVRLRMDVPAEEAQ